MFELVAVTYSVIASFVVASAARNRRNARNNPPILELFGWLLMTFSGTTGVGLLACAAYSALTGTPPII